MSKALPVLLTVAAFALTPTLAVADTGTGAADTANPAPVEESWMAGPEKAEPSTGEDPSTADAVDPADIEAEGSANSEAEGSADIEADDPAETEAEAAVPELSTVPKDRGWIDPDADVATADPKDLGVSEHRMEVFTAPGAATLAAPSDAK